MFSMGEEEGFPRIETIFDPSAKNGTHPLYKEAIRSLLKQILPERFFDPKWVQERSIETARKKFFALLPLVKKVNDGTDISFLCLFKYRANAFKFFFDLVSNWLVPGRRLDVISLFAIDFRLPFFGEDVITLCEVIIRTETEEERAAIEHHFSIIEQEACLGVDSEYYARKILEIKGVTLDQKTSLIQQRVTRMAKRLPHVFEGDVLAEMQHLLVLSHDDFKKERSVQHLSRMVLVHSLFRNSIQDEIKDQENRRKVLVKVFRTQVNFPNGKKNVLTLMVGLNFLKDKEVFEQRHLLKAIKHYVPSVEAIDQTFFSNRKGGDSIATFYLELEKNDGKPFSPSEIGGLKTHLAGDIQNHIGRLLSPVFMPRNEEEIMRNILTLSSQLKFLRDIPQVFISFDEQTERNLFFTVIFVRICQGGEKSIQETLKLEESFLRYIHDRTRIVGSLRKKYPKEATVFRVKLAKENFLRGDHSIDLYRARQAVVSELSRSLGEFRDFNGGMISKQNELLTEVKRLLKEEGMKYNEILLENFFYSLAPVIMRTLLEPHALKTLFQMLLEQQGKGLPKGQKISLKWKYETDFSFVLMTARQRSILDEFSKTLNRAHHTSSDMAQGFVKTAEYVSLGYIFRSNDVLKQAQFHALVSSLAEACPPVKI